MNAARVMTGKDFDSLFSERREDFASLEFLDSLEICLAHPTGRDYLERYLEQTFSPEYVEFLKSFDEFKKLRSPVQRWEKAMEIYENNFAVNARARIDLEDFSVANRVLSLPLPLPISRFSYTFIFVCFAPS